MGAYAGCVLSEDQTEAVEGPWSTTLTEEGIYFFVCGVKTHCSADNQKAEMVEVTGVGGPLTSNLNLAAELVLKLLLQLSELGLVPSSATINDVYFDCHREFRLSPC